MFVVHRRSLSSTRENTTDTGLYFSPVAKSGGNKQNSCNREQISHVTQDSLTPKYERRKSVDHEASHLACKTPQNNHHSGKKRWIVKLNCIRTVTSRLVHSWFTYSSNFLPRNSCHRVFFRLSVHLPISPSVTHWYSIQIAKYSIKQAMPHNSLGTVVFWH